MAKPKVFVSSTYYDLKHIRASLEAFIQSLGYESILFESGDIAFQNFDPLDISCYNAVENVHLFVLIIGGRYGSRASDQINTLESSQIKTALAKMYEAYNSITFKEYETARQKGIPIYTFIEKNVAAEYGTYKKNKHNDNVEYAHVDSINIFKLIENIYSQPTNNQIKTFEHFDDISSWLRNQWAGIFAEYLSKRQSDMILDDLSTQVSKISSISNALKSYSEAILRKVGDPADESKSIIDPIQKQLLTDEIANTPFIGHFLRNYLEKTGQTYNIDLLLSYISKAPDLMQFKNLLGMDVKDLYWMEVHNISLIKQYRQLRKNLADMPNAKEIFKDKPAVLDPSMTTETQTQFEMRQESRKKIEEQNESNK